MNKTYRVVLQGLKDGFAREKVLAELVTLFKKKPEEIAPLLDAKRTVVKKGVDLATARKYEEVLERRGCACIIETDAAFSADATQVMRRYSPGDEEEFFGGGAALAGTPAKAAAAPTPPPPARKPEPVRSPVAADRKPAQPAAAAGRRPRRDVAKYQRLLLIGIGVNAIGAVGLPLHLGWIAGLLLLASGIFNLWAVYRLCRALELSAAPWMVAMFVPLLNLLGVVYLIRKAGGALRPRG